MSVHQSKNFYELLGISKEATKKEIKLAYKEIALVYHPDSNFFDEIVEDGGMNDMQDTLFKTISDAYTTLSNPVSRAQYDETLPPELPGWNSEPEDIVAAKVSKYKPGDMHNSGATSEAFGVFGKVRNDEEESAFTSPFLNEAQAHNLRYQPPQAGILDKILRFIGF